MSAPRTLPPALFALALLAVPFARAQDDGRFDAGPLLGGKSPPPGVVQDILAAVTSVLEKQAKDAPDAPLPADVGPIAGLTARKLGVRLDARARADLQTAWQAFVAQEGPTLRGDQPRALARKILVWQMQWVYREHQRRERQQP